tara:strand:- start:524 stop:1231 length:708 start_codon:yes stop_codon:yes gene_type:complete
MYHLAMCGRFALGIPRKRLEEALGCPAPESYVPRYNIGPSQDVLVIEEQDGVVSTGYRSWGLIPHWAKARESMSGLINARSETVFEKPAFRDTVRRTRCLVPAQAFYEWGKTGNRKQPYAIGMNSGEVFAMAGIGSRWIDPVSGEVVDSIAILTCQPNEKVAAIHDRMPVIVDAIDWNHWLNNDNNTPAQLGSLLVPYPADRMRIWPVSTAVNSVTNDTHDLLRPESRATQGSLF